ncbi:MAG: ABC transporter ATP-binding protein [Halobacteriovoraceae bacterium]|nr:ABC transporter ATP-binding protein [Halobacteriovoraceae bacterium]
MTAIQATGVSKSYGATQALSDFSISVEPSKIVALLGPNGAGKTTFVKSLLDLVSPDSGEILINGINSTSSASREGVAYLPEKFSFFPYYTVEMVVAFYGKMHGLRGSELNQRVGEALEKLKIPELRKKKINTLSKGQLQRTGIANTLMCQGNLMIFDEPFSGLDAIGIRELKLLFKDLREQGKTVLLNSHILSEMEQVCDEFILLNKGKIIAKGNLKTELEGKSLEDFFYDKVENSQ